MATVRFVSANKPKQWWSRILAPVVTLAGLGALSLVYPQLLGNGFDVTQQAFADDLSLPKLAVRNELS